MTSSWFGIKSLLDRFHHEVFIHRILDRGNAGTMICDTKLETWSSRVPAAEILGQIWVPEWLWRWDGWECFFETLRLLRKNCIQYLYIQQRGRVQFPEREWRNCQVLVRSNSAISFEMITRLTRITIFVFYPVPELFVENNYRMLKPRLFAISLNLSRRIGEDGRFFIRVFSWSSEWRWWDWQWIRKIRESISFMGRLRYP